MERLSLEVIRRAVTAPVRNYRAEQASIQRAEVFSERNDLTIDDVPELANLMKELQSSDAVLKLSRKLHDITRASLRNLIYKSKA
jgi:hypothetical protein